MKARVNFSKTSDIYLSTYIFEKNNLLLEVDDSETVSVKSQQNYKFFSMPYLETEMQIFFFFSSFLDGDGPDEVSSTGQNLDQLIF